MAGTWNTTSPDGTKSVSTNNTIIQNNTTYVKANLDLDHYWDSSANNDGHHRFVQSPKSDTAGTPVDPTVATGMDGALYFKQKTSAESPSVQNVFPFFKDDAASPAILEMLGIRACGVFTMSGAVITTRYVHNVAPSTAGTPGIVRTAAGRFTVTFTNPSPSDYYLVMGGAIRDVASATDVGTFVLNGSNTDPVASKTTTQFQFGCYTLSGSPTLFDPNQAWFVCFGG